MYIKIYAELKGNGRTLICKGFINDNKFAFHYNDRNYNINIFKSMKSAGENVSLGSNNVIVQQFENATKEEILEKIKDELDKKKTTEKIKVKFKEEWIE